MFAALLPIALAGYLSGIALASLGTGYRSARARRGASWCFALTWLAQLAAVVHQGWLTGRPPPTNLGEFLLVLGWAVLALHLYVWFRLRVDVAGLVLPPIAAVATFAAMLILGRGESAGERASGTLLVFHTTSSTLGLATLCVAFAMSLIYLVQDRALKSHRTLRWLERFPALARADQIGFHALVLGFVLLTLGIVTGIVANAELHSRLWVPGPKQTFPLFAWMTFLAILGLRALAGFRGRKSAYLTIAGFALGLLTILGIAF